MLDEAPFFHKLCQVRLDGAAFCARMPFRLRGGEPAMVVGEGDKINGKR